MRFKPQNPIVIVFSAFGAKMLKFMALPCKSFLLTQAGDALVYVTEEGRARAAIIVG